MNIHYSEDTLTTLDKPLAYINGHAMDKMPRDLYIPPDAMEVMLETFTGPLDLLLYLIKRHNLDILNIPVAEITRQYMVYINIIKDLRLELAADYMLMAATLAGIKARCLIVQPQTEDDAADPRAELVRRLQEYERYKSAANDLDGLPRIGRDVFVLSAAPASLTRQTTLPTVSIDDLTAALAELLKRGQLFSHHHIQREALSVRERMAMLLVNLSSGGYSHFFSLLKPGEGRRGVVVTFLAVLELVRETLIAIREQGPTEDFALKAFSTAAAPTYRGLMLCDG